MLLYGLMDGKTWGVNFAKVTVDGPINEAGEEDALPAIDTPL